MIVQLCRLIVNSSTVDRAGGWASRRRGSWPPRPRRAGWRTARRGSSSPRASPPRSRARGPAAAAGSRAAARQTDAGSFGSDQHLLTVLLELDNDYL